MAIQVTKQVQKNSFISYVLSDGFWVIANLCKPIYDIINYSTSICPSESGKCGKEEKNLQKFEYLENEKWTQALKINVIKTFKTVNFLTCLCKIIIQTQRYNQ